MKAAFIFGRAGGGRARRSAGREIKVEEKLVIDQAGAGLVPVPTLRQWKGTEGEYLLRVDQLIGENLDHLVGHYGLAGIERAAKWKALATILGAQLYPLAFTVNATAPQGQRSTPDVTKRNAEIVAAMEKRIESGQTHRQAAGRVASETGLAASTIRDIYRAHSKKTDGRH